MSKASARTIHPIVRRLKRDMRWVSRIAIGVMVVAALLLIFLLVRATDNHQLYVDHYGKLVVINIVIAILLAVTVTWGLLRLLLRLKQGRFGSRLLLKLAAIFALVGVLPGLLIYGVSYQFVSRSIESWFDVKVEGALASGVTLARTSLDTQARDFGEQLRQASRLLDNVSDESATLPLERLRQQIGASDASLWSSSGKLIATVGESRTELAPARPSSRQMRLTRQQGVATRIEGIDRYEDNSQASAAADGKRTGAYVSALALVRGGNIDLLGGQRVIEAQQALPPTLVEDALNVQQAFSEYQQRAIGRHGLRRMYIGTLTLSLFLAIFGAILLAVVLGRQLAAPLLMLAHGVRQVAAGDLRPKVVMQGRDELVGLTRSFADMTRQLAEARASVDASMRQVDTARGRLQTILDNLTAGVIVLDEQGHIRTVNPGATRILRAPMAAYQGRLLSSVPRLEDFSSNVYSRFVEFESISGEHEIDHWQQAFKLDDDGEGEKANTISLLARGARLPDGQRLLVFDDISEIVSAQRSQAWGEVARRLAHEIKNPLTPIQLAAERMEMRFADLLPDKERGILERSVKTIVDQVGAMQRLVDEFRDYARLPAANLQAIDINELVRDILHLYGLNQDDGDNQLNLYFEPDLQCPPVAGDAQQLRQVIHNLVQNALDATQDDKLPPRTTPDPVMGMNDVFIRSQWMPDNKRVRLLILDRGPGFPDTVIKRIFEPYVTTKSKGTGLGMAVVKKIADEHDAHIEVGNRIIHEQVVGAQVSLTFKTAAAVLS